MECYSCNGTGRVTEIVSCTSGIGKPCPICNGTGELSVICAKEESPKIERSRWENVQFMIKGLREAYTKQYYGECSTDYDAGCNAGINIARNKFVKKLDMILQEMDRVDPKEGKE